MYTSIDNMKHRLAGILTGIGTGTITILNESQLRSEAIDELVYTAVFAPSNELKDAARGVIQSAADVLGVKPASIQPLYEAMGRYEVKGFTVPAINIRGLTYDTARAVFQTVHHLESGAFIFEIAKTEIGYTDQKPAEYATVILAAAIKEGYRGPLFIQGDHVQANAKRYSTDPEQEIESLKKVILEEINARFYNIDVDTSTLVDLSLPTLDEQQRANYENAAKLTQFIREHQPQGVTISVGGEIGEVGGKNSTPEDLHAFMKGYLSNLNGHKGISKISVQTGTSHGGVVLPDGSIAKVKLDFDTLRVLSEIARKDYGMSGAVQHGASTLPPELFDKFPQVGASEIHLATEFQNMIYALIPSELREDIYAWIRANLSGERKVGETEEQFIYKTRKKGFGPFKQQFWDLPEDVRQNVREELRKKFEFLFTKLNVANTAEVVQKYVRI
ncbi:MAG: class II fructose-bisphosphate aldolase [Bacteroidota bacterium]